MSIVELNNIFYQYDDEACIFKGLNFSLPKGRRVGIMGPTGSGKTTLLYIIMGLIQPQKGEVVLFDKVCRKEKDFFRPRRKIGYLFQDPDDQVFCATVEEDIAFGPLNLGMSPEEASGVVNKVSKELGLASLQRRITTKLSWGQKRLVSLAGVIAMNPELLILDEPTASIDDEVIENISSYLRRTDYSLIIVSHDKGFLNSLCDTIYTLKSGFLV